MKGRFWSPLFWVVLLLVAACGGGSNSSSDNPSETGSIVFQVEWQEAPILTGGSSIRADVDCAAAGVSTVEVRVYDENDALLKSGGPWSCSVHSGTITDVRAGSNRKIVILGNDLGGSYIYRGEVNGVTIIGGQTYNAGTISVSSFSPTLSAPANSSTVTNCNFSFLWGWLAGFRYEIQVDDSSSFANVNITQTVNGGLYTPSTLIPGTYYWRVRTLDAYGNGSKWSDPWTCTVSTAQGQPPSAPTGVSVSAGKNQVVVSWNSVLGATSYNIYWALNSGVTKSTGTKIADVNSPYPHTGLTNGTTYYYVVTAVNSCGESQDSGEIYASAQFIWAKTYGGTSSDYAFEIQQTTNGGYVVAANTYSFGHGQIDFWVLMLNQDGSIAWQMAYGGTSGEEARSIKQTADGGYIVLGTTYSFGAGSNDIWVLKLSSNGAITWQKTFGGTDYDFAGSVYQTSDGGYIVAEANAVSGVWNILMLKLDPNGTVVWQKKYQNSYSSYAYSVQQTSDGGYIVAGDTASTTAEYMWLLKLDSSGNIVWQKAYADATSGAQDRATSVQQTKDGGYIVAGYTKTFGAGGYDFAVLRLDSDGNIIWQKTYGGTSDDIPSSIRQTTDNGYIVAGFTQSFGAGGRDAWVLKLDSVGTIVWQKTYGGTADDYANSIAQTTDGGYVVPGQTASFGAGSTDAWVLKLASDGTIGCGIGVDSSATVLTPSFVITNLTATVTNTSLTVTNTSTSGTSSAATVNTQCQ